MDESPRSKARNNECKLWPVVLSCLLRGVGLRVHIFIDAIGAETQWKLEADVSKLE